MEVEVGHHSVLLTRCEGRFSAIGNQCTHYGAPLSKGIKECDLSWGLSWPLCWLCFLWAGAFQSHTVRCPWHGACFNVLTGDLEEYPGIDSLPCHKVNTGSMAEQIQGQTDWLVLPSYQLHLSFYLRSKFKTAKSTYLLTNGWVEVVSSLVFSCILFLLICLT